MGLPLRQRRYRYSVPELSRWPVDHQSKLHATGGNRTADLVLMSSIRHCRATIHMPVAKSHLAEKSRAKDDSQILYRHRVFRFVL